MTDLFDPFTIKNIPIKNRICVPPMVCYGWADGSGDVVEKNVEHYRAIAKGGAGLIIQEATCICPDGRLSMDQLGLWNDEQIAGLKKIVDAVHEEGVPIFVQIHHAGVLGEEDDLVCPSEYTCEHKNRTKHAREMTLEEIHIIEQQFIDAAGRAYLAGYDGVEIHGCHGYLLCEFMNRRVNQRQDAYNADSMLLLENIINGIRAVTPPEFVVGIRLGAFEPTLDDGLTHARWLAAHGIDFIDVSYGFTFEMDKTVPENYPLIDVQFGAQEIKKAVDVPVFAVFGIDSKEKAQKVLHITNVDMVDVGRGTLVNYSWANDALAGVDTGHCLNCKECMWRIDTEKCAGKIILNGGKKHA